MNCSNCWKPATNKAYLLSVYKKIQQKTEEISKISNFCFTAEDNLQQDTKQKSLWTSCSEKQDQTNRKGVLDSLKLEEQNSLTLAYTYCNRLRQGDYIL